MENKKIFWSGNFDWKYGEKGIVIGKKEYAFRKFFPDIYFLTVNGCTREEICSHFSENDRDTVIEVVGLMLANGILTDGVCSPDQFFERMYKSYPDKDKYPDDLIMRNDLITEFRKSALARRKPDGNETVIKLAQTEREGSQRRSTRVFDAGKKISFNVFSELLDSMRQYRSGENIYYDYPSAGGLYPVDIYIYVKKDRVEGLEGGIYEYVPSGHSLRCVHCNEVPEKCHFFGNREIFRTSAFSVYFFYNTDASMPKYHGAGYYYAIIDSGIMLEKLTLDAEKLGLGSCIIGVFDIKKAAGVFETGRSQIYLHCMEFGIPAGNEK